MSTNRIARPKVRKLDKQQVELVGRAHLETRLLQEGFEIARPIRDRGVDLVTYCENSGFPMMPIQLKAFVGQSFNLDKKYARRGIVMAYVWNCNSAQPEVYIMTYRQAVQMLSSTQRQTISWKKHGRYSITRVTPDFARRFKKYQNAFHVLRGEQ